MSGRTTFDSKGITKKLPICIYYKLKIGDNSELIDDA